MPAIESREIGIALDMHGCPNRCRHCCLGRASNKHMTEDDVRWAAAQFRSYVKPGEGKPFIEKLSVSSWFREPDYSDDYERLYDLEAELSDGEPARYELLSIWRLARDPRYAEWAKKVGPDACQISFFGMEETNDWFYRRKGAFRDYIAATERLLDVGMKPRWQFFLTKKILPDLPGLMRLMDRMKIRDRVQALGGEFVFFMHAPGFEGEGRTIRHLAATADDLSLIPAEITESTTKHFKNDKTWTTEAEVIRAIMDGEEKPEPAYGMPKRLYFFIAPNWDVFSGIGTLEAWWKLGNLRTDTVDVILDNFENDRPLGYQVNRTVSRRELAERFGDPDSRAVIGEFDAGWLAEYCEEVLRSTAGCTG